MKITLKNEFLELTVNTVAAEMNELRDVKTDTQYVWNGDPSVWKFHAPVLFPHVGRIRDQYMTVDGKEYSLINNGFSRDEEHKVVSQSQTAVTFELTDNEFSATRFPWKFKLNIAYALEGKSVRFTTTVTNTDSTEMLYTLGSHTAFWCPRPTDPAGTKNSDYQIEFEKKEPLQQIQCTDDGYLAFGDDGLAPSVKPYGEKEPGIIPLTEKGFGNGHFFTRFTSDWVGLRNKKDGSLVKVNTKGYPNCMIWQNAGDPNFVCIEPWYGMPDPCETDHDWRNKPGLMSLAPGASFTADQSITIE